MSFDLAEVVILKRLDHDHINRSLERRRSWREHALQRHVNTKNVFPWSVTGRLKEITEETAENLHLMCDLLQAVKHKFKLVTSGNQAWIYTNELALIQQFSELDMLQSKTYTQAVINRPADTIMLKNSVYTSRSYLRSPKLDPKDAANLRSFLNIHRDNIRLSPALSQWAAQSKLRLADYFFIDYCGESWLTMLSLVRPGLIRKTIKIIPAK
jgi:hypothetical protein